MAEAWIVDAVRTPIGKHRGALKDVRADDLAAIPLRAVLDRTGVPGERVDEVFMGCANQAGEDARNVARMAALLAGLPQSVPAATLNRLCGCGIEAMLQAARMIRLGEADVVLAGGVESMTRAPWSMPKPSEAFPTGKVEAYDTSLGWRFPNPAWRRCSRWSRWARRRRTWRRSAACAARTRTPTRSPRTGRRWRRRRRAGSPGNWWRWRSPRQGPAGPGRGRRGPAR